MGKYPMFVRRHSKCFWVEVATRYYYLKRNSDITDPLPTLNPGFAFLIIG